MVTNITYGKKLSDSDLGCDFYEVLCATFSGKIEVCHVKVSDIQKIALAFTKIVQKINHGYRS